jgi:KDO2-lipid IV(A) lauroyltransferase
MPPHVRQNAVREVPGSSLPTRRQLRFKLEYSAFRGFLAVGKCLPLEWAAGFSGMLWRLVAPHLSRHARGDRQLAAMMPELTAAERRSILLQMWRSLGQTFMEALLLPSIIAQPDRISVDAAGAAAIRRMVSEAGIVAVPHIGNWELATIPLAAAGADHATVYRAPTNPLVDAHIRSVRAPLFTGGLFAKGAAAANRLMRHARRGGSVAVMADLCDRGGCEVPLFGRPAPSTTFPALLARQLDRPLFAACLVRVGPVRFRLEVAEIKVDRSDDRERDLYETTARIQQVFEAWIRQWPGQWMWAQRRY